MKQAILFLVFLCVSFSLSAQRIYYERNANEGAEKFLQRVLEDDIEFIHPVIEATWNGKKVIIAFWHEKVKESKTNSRDAVGKMYVPVNNSNTYQEIHIDRVPESPMEANIYTVLFDDADGDGKRELIVLYGWNYKHYQMEGTIYHAYVYDDIDYNRLPARLRQIDSLNGGILGHNADESFTPDFSTADEIRAYLDKRGRKPNKDFFIKSFEGKIGKDMDVEFYLSKYSKNEISGFYFYKKRGFDIYVSGTIKNDVVNLKEKDDERNTTATITGRFTEKGFSGTWKNAKTGKTYPVELKELDYNIDAQPRIEGDYEGCGIELSIRKKKQNYVYTFKTYKQQKSGSLRLARDVEDGITNVYICLDDIKWHDYKGSLMDVEELGDAPSYDMYGIEGLWNDGSIIIQNGGNAMNYYVKLEECDSKYIELRRKNKDE